jgi:two-component system, OmpR family, sensor histidine kinase ArlS
MKLSLKINLLFTLIVSGILLVMAVIIYNISRQNVRREFEQRLENRAARTAYLYTVFRNDTTNLLKSLDANAPPQLFNKSIIVYNLQHHILYEYHDLPLSAFRPDTSLLSNMKPGSTYFFMKDGKDACIHYREADRDDFLVVVAADNVSGKEYINDLRGIFLVFLPGAVLFTLIAGYLFSLSIIKPIKETIHDAKLITSQNLSKRLFVGKRKDELAQLNATFNDLLNRLEESFSIQRRFISNASHELSTPLTSVSSQIEVALLQDRSADQYKQVLQSILEDVQELNQLTKNLLEIAKAGTHGTISLDKIRLDEVLFRAHGEVLKQHPGFKIIIKFEDLPEDENECSVFGNSHLLHSAFKNIMENGCKYSPDNTVHVKLSFRGQDAELTFINKSDTLSADELNRLFEPFYRSLNAEGQPGVGLGLTLTRRIIGLHKGTLKAESDPEKGTIFTIVLPTLKK